ncbi:MAG TPA: membrane dipeptidase [Burkholderiaceae bacterium]
MTDRVDLHDADASIDPRAGRGLARRRLLQAAGAWLAVGVGAVRAQPRLPIADLHSHYGLITRSLATSGLADDLRQQRVALMAWKLVADGRWIGRTPTGIVQKSEPAPGELLAYFHSRLDRMKAYAAQQRLTTVLSAADVQACIADDGPPGIVLASEGADFLEGRLGNLQAAYDKGLRHLQLVHYIRTPVGDFQTVPPVHDGLSALGRLLVEACNDKGMLVDLAHSTPQSVDQALQISRAPLVWSHGWVDRAEGRFTDPFGFLQRRLALDQAKAIADKGGVVGLWGLGLAKPRAGWSVAARDTRAYANELAALVDKIGRDHVAFGTDIEGVGPNWAVNDYGGVRAVLDHLQQMKLPSETIERVAYGNYARVLKAALG